MAGLPLLLGVIAAVWGFWRRRRTSIGPEAEGFPLDSLSRLRDAGKRSDREYQALRASIIDELRAGIQESDRGTDL